MGVRIVQHDYGKARVRVLKVRRRGDVHDVRELTVQVLAEGDFAETYVTGDNRRVLPTDTIKNTVYALARKESVDRIETFALALADHFLARHAPIQRVRVEIVERAWARITTRQGEHRLPHPHSFVAAGAESWVATVVRDRDALPVRHSGFDGLRVMKTTGSGFEGYARDEWTTLPETKDRILATEVVARWLWGDAPPADFAAANSAIRDAMLEVFANEYSPSVQNTLLLMGQAALDRCAQVREIRLSMPNLHANRVDLAPLGLDNPNEIFVPTDEPHGLIEATLARE